MRFIAFLCFLILFLSCKEDDPADTTPEIRMQISYLRMGGENLLTNDSDLPVDQPVVIAFSVPVDRSTVEDNILLTDEDDQAVPLTVTYQDDDATIAALPADNLEMNTRYTLTITSAIRGAAGEVFPGFSTAFTTANPPLSVISLSIDDQEVDDTGRRVKNIAREPAFVLAFSENVTTEQLQENIRLVRGNQQIPLSLVQESETAISIATEATLSGWERYRLIVSPGLGDELDKPFEPFDFSFYTEVDSTLKFPEIPDEELLTKVQEQTFKYFWDFAHPESGLARERNTSGDLVTSGGSGFGLMAIIVGIERGFITRQEGIERLDKLVTFLSEADRFHGAWPHWLSGSTGEVIPFSTRDDGGDLVETSFMAQGLLTVRQYLDAADPEESNLISQINTLWEGIEWDWYTRSENVLYWHWSPDYGWEMNHRIQGYNEALITYVLAAASPTHPIDAAVYHEGWARSGAMVNGRTFYGIELPVGYDFGGPLFFAHYSFLGLDPRSLSDQYADYWTQNVHHTLINREHALRNPQNYVGYSGSSWGFTASDNHEGYNAHSPTNDLGVITPTAAISSIPYTPEESMESIRFFYYILGDRLWGEYGFYDAFNPTEGWVASSYLAIDQGPIIIMIENYRTGLLWELFMSAPEVQAGLDKLGFNYE